MKKRQNMIRGYMNLWVWKEAKDLFNTAYSTYRKFPPELKKVVSNHIASIDSVHRNIAEGYCRKSKVEYLRFLDIAIASLAEFTSGNHVYFESNLLTEREFESLDSKAFKIENGLKNLMTSLRKKKKNEWNDSFEVREPSSGYGIINPVQKIQKWEIWNQYSLKSIHSG